MEMEESMIFTGEKRGLPITFFLMIWVKTGRRDTE